MASERQIAANRRNAGRSTGPRTRDGKLRSSQNAVRHGLSAETVVTALEDPGEYQALESTLMDDYGPQTEMDRQLVARLASLVWRLRRATLIETELFGIQTNILLHRRNWHNSATPSTTGDLNSLFRILKCPHGYIPSDAGDCVDSTFLPTTDEVPGSRQKSDAASVFLRLCNNNYAALERLDRYDTRLWKQLMQTILMLDASTRRRIRPQLSDNGD